MLELRKDAARTGRDVEAQNQVPGDSKSARRLQLSPKLGAKGRHILLDLQKESGLRREGLHFEVTAPPPLDGGVSRDDSEPVSGWMVGSQRLAP
jgi:hypothetical protein